MGERYTEIGGGKGEFPVTVWKDILAAKDKTSGDNMAKMELLIQMYWKPAYCYIRHAWKKGNEEAKDLTQEFFARFLEKDFIKTVSPEKGRFRTFMKVVLRRFLIDIARKRSRQKRGGDVAVVRFEDVGHDPTKTDPSEDPSELFDREWAKTILSRSYEALKGHLSSKGKRKYFEIFKDFNLAQESGEGISYLDLAKKHGVKETDVKNHLHYTRRLFRRIIEDEVSMYVSDAAEVEEEIRFLLSRKL